MCAALLLIAMARPRGAVMNAEDTPLADLGQSDLMPSGYSLRWGFLYVRQHRPPAKKSPGMGTGAEVYVVPVPFGANRLGAQAACTVIEAAPRLPHAAGRKQKRRSPVLTEERQVCLPMNAISVAGPGGLSTEHRSRRSPASNVSPRSQWSRRVSLRATGHALATEVKTQCTALVPPRL
jgi:hypothetical protein